MRSQPSAFTGPLRPSPLWLYAALPAALSAEPVVAQFLDERQIPARLKLAGERSAHGEEVGGRRDVVDAEDVRARLHAVGKRGQRARETLARGTPGERADEVLT